MIREIIFLKGERDLWISFAERCDNFIMVMWIYLWYWEDNSYFLSNWNGVVFVKVLNSWRYRAQKNKKVKKINK